jgi:hypothetical protein
MLLRVKKNEFIDIYIILQKKEVFIGYNSLLAFYIKLSNQIYFIIFLIYSIYKNFNYLIMKNFIIINFFFYL